MKCMNIAYINIFLVIIVLTIEILRNIHLYYQSHQVISIHTFSFVNYTNEYVNNYQKTMNLSINSVSNHINNNIIQSNTYFITNDINNQSNNSHVHIPIDNISFVIDIKTYTVINHSNDFIHLVRNILTNTNPNNIIHFGGKQVKELLDPLTLTDGVSLTNRNRFNSWIDIVNLINHSKSLQLDNKAVRVHNEMKFGDLLQYIILHSKKINKNKIIMNDEQYFLNGFDLNQSTIVLTNSVDENWGFLSTRIGTRTTKWINMTNHLLIHGANYQTVNYFLNSNKVLLLLVCNTHVDPMIGSHPKIISLPLGIRGSSTIYHKVMEFSQIKVNKTKLLLISNSGWGDRIAINEQVSKSFHGIITNTYRRNPNSDHYRQVAESLFVLCPSGLGFDTYRLWETIILGSIPIVESNKGFDRTYVNLPVLVVNNFTDLTPQLLMNSYECFYRNKYNYRYNHILKDYWINLIELVVKYGNISHVMDNHPLDRPFCNYVI